MINYDLKYKIAVDLIKKGYLIHCTNEDFNSFDSSYIKGGFRSKEGYGFYFSDMPYKPIEYGDVFKVIKKSDFNFLDSSTPISCENFNNKFKSEIARLEYRLEDVRTSREYDAINDEINQLRAQYNKIGGDELFRNIETAIKQYHAKTIGGLEYNIPNPQSMLPKLTQLYVYWGYDGYVTDGIYTVFNFDKLNRLVETIDVENYNMNESLDLSSFEVKNELNPHLWKNDKIDSRIRLKLLDIADDFTDFLNVDWVEPEDITMTGSLANYNWSEEYSDIDLHIIIDYKKVDNRTEFVKEYFNSKKELWNQKHQNIKIYGFPVEVYVQDKNEPHASSGVYSLEKNDWIVKPEQIVPEKSELKKAEKDAEKWIEKIDSLVDRYCPDKTDSQKEEIINDLDDVFDDIKDSRKKGFSSGGDEMNKNNLTFKMLRRGGYLDKIYDKKNEIYDDLMSINEGCWGYELFDNDDSLDKRDDFIKKTLKYLTNNLDKADSKITGSGSEKFSWATLLYDFIIKNKKESSYLDEYQQALKKCINFFTEYNTEKYLKSYSEPEKMKKTLEKTIDNLKKCVSSD